MREMTLFAVATTAVILASAAGVWTASTTDTQASARTGSRIDTIQMTSGARNLPAEHFADYSLVF